MELKSFSPQDAEAIFNLAERLTGNSVRGNLILSNVARRLEVTGCTNLFEYLRFVELKAEELPYLISGLVVHTTSWFREEPHFPRFKNFIDANLAEFKKRPLRFLSSACSTGEEVYSFGLILEWYRQNHPGFDYQIEGKDIDLLCINRGMRAVYSKQDIERVPAEYRSMLLEGNGRTVGLFTVCESLRQRCKFTTWNLVKLGAETEKIPQFDFIVCRNVLIYFNPKVVEKVVSRLLALLHPKGALCLGHSESIDYKKYDLDSLGNSVYVFPKEGSRREAPSSGDAGGESEAEVREGRSILVVDDSAAVRKVLVRLLEGTEFRAALVGSANEASEYLKEHTVDLITLDLHMPGTDGQTWLARERKKGMRIPVVIISDDFPSEASSTFGALESGAQDYFHKGQIVTGRDELLSRFRDIIQAAEEKNKGGAVRYESTGELKLMRPELVMIGASIGGPDAIARLIRDLPRNMPPLLVCQHMSVNFSRAFSEHLARLAGLKLGKILDNIPLEPGTLYMSDGDYHIGAKRRNGKFFLVVSDSEPVKRHRPSIDFLFGSLNEKSGGDRIFAAILTGMGADGAEGLLKLRHSGAMTFAQEPKSCVVFGMAKEAIRHGAVSYIGTISDIRRQLDLAMQMGESSESSGA